MLHHLNKTLISNYKNTIKQLLDQVRFLTEARFTINITLYTSHDFIKVIYFIQNLCICAMRYDQLTILVLSQFLVTSILQLP